MDYANFSSHLKSWLVVSMITLCIVYWCILGACCLISKFAGNRPAFTIRRGNEEENDNKNLLPRRNS